MVGVKLNLVDGRHLARRFDEGSELRDCVVRYTNRAREFLVAHLDKILPCAEDVALDGPVDEKQIDLVNLEVAQALFY